VDGLNHEIEIHFGPGTPFPCTIGGCPPGPFDKKPKAGVPYGAFIFSPKMDMILGEKGNTNR